MVGKEHLVGLERGSDEYTGKGDDWQANALGEVLISKSLEWLASFRVLIGVDSYISIVILAEHIQEPTVKSRPHDVKLVDESMFQPIDNHLTTKNHNERPHQLSRPLRERSEALWERGRRSLLQRSEDISATASHAHLDQVSHENDDKHQPKLKPLNNIRADQLE